MTEFNKWHMQQTEGVKHHCTALAELTKHNSTSEQRACFFSFAASAWHIRQHYWSVTLRSRQSSPKPDIPPFPKINSDRRCLLAPRSRERILMAAKVPAGECFKIQPATMGNILAIKKNLNLCQRQLLSPLRLQNTLIESIARVKNKGSNQSDLLRANERSVYLMPSDICLLLFRPILYISMCK